MKSPDFYLDLSRRRAEEARAAAGSSGQSAVQLLAQSHVALIDYLISKDKE